MGIWRVGSKVPINVYEDDAPVCQCHTPEMAARIVRAMNGHKSTVDPELEQSVQNLGVIKSMPTAKPVVGRISKELEEILTPPQDREPLPAKRRAEREADPAPVDSLSEKPGSE